VARATAAWERAYWASLPEWEHQVVTDARPALYACFNQADLLVSDVSSVVSDFLASGKPYAVANTTGLSEAAFRAAFPTAGAATVLAPDAVGVRELLDAVRQPGPDELAEARAELKRRLLGADEPSSQERFDMAVQALCAVARNRRVPGQRRDEETVSVSGTLIPPG
jgi:CDP-glycerol glycerophosphotransferase (TagB/SpsB family)